MKNQENPDSAKEQAGALETVNETTPSVAEARMAELALDAREVTKEEITEREQSELAEESALLAKIKGGSTEIVEKTEQENYAEGWKRIWGKNKDSISTPVEESSTDKRLRDVTARLAELKSQPESSFQKGAHGEEITELEKEVASLEERRKEIETKSLSSSEKLTDTVMETQPAPHGSEKSVEAVVEKVASSDTKIETKKGVSEETLEKRTEVKKLQVELEDARKNLALAEKNDPKYAEIQKNYQTKTEAMKSFVYEAKKGTLLKRGLSEADVEKELSKYTREILAPNFAVSEAAKMQDEKADETMLEKVKDSRVSQMIYGAVEKYRKLPFKQKMMISAGLIGGAVVAGVAGGTAGALIGGGVGIAKFGQRILGSAGTAVGLEAWMQKSQQKWMAKEGWGRNRKEYVANEIHRLRAGVREGGVKAESLEGVAGLEEVEKALEERKELEDKFEKRRTALAGIGGVAVGSGVAFQAVKQYGEWVKQFGEWTGVTDKVGEIAQFFGEKTGANELYKNTTQYWGEYFNEKKNLIFGGIKEQAHVTGEHVQEKILPIAIGTRGPEGALIDNFRAHPEMAKAFGWDGKSKLSEWAGAKAGELWNNDAKEALKNPKILAQMEKLGFSKDADGYAKMAHRIGKGFLQIDPTGKNIKFTDMEYLKNTTKELKTLLGDDGIMAPRSVSPDEFLKGATQRAFTTAGPSEVKPITDFVNQGLTSEQSNPFHPEVVQGKVKPITDFVNEGLTQGQKNPFNSPVAPKDVLMEGYVSPTTSIPEQVARGTHGTEIPTPEIEVKNIATKTENIGVGKTLESAGVDVSGAGFKGTELFSSRWTSTLKYGGAEPTFYRDMARATGRGISSQLAAYNELLSNGKAEEATKRLSAIYTAVEIADKELGVGVIDHSKIPGMK